MRNVPFIYALILTLFGLLQFGCKPYCGDGTCDSGEEGSCSLDCFSSAYCGDGVCAPIEMTNCAADCLSNDYCGDGFCDSARENSVSCPIDCLSSQGYCGDSVCSPNENSFSCSIDCQSSVGYCGDGICQQGESCSADCSVTDCWARNGFPTTNVELFNSYNYMMQSCQQWCWSACATMVGQYFGKHATQCTLMSLRAGFSDLNTCCQYAACSYQVCDTPAPHNDITNLYLYALGLNVVMLTSPISEAAVVNEISNGRPIEIAYTNSFSGHVVLITGLQYWGPNQYTYTVMDPWYGTFSGVTYQQLLYGYMSMGVYSYWSHTWYHIAPVQNGCPIPPN